MATNLISHYSRPDILKIMLSLAKHREIGVRYGDQGFGKRPDILQYEGDITALAKQGATSFHCSEERWSDPLSLQPGMRQKELEALRMGYDLVLDIDSNFLDYSKICAELLVEALWYHDVRHFGIKFSGRGGFHILVPFEALPLEIHGKAIRLFFPDGVRIVAHYLKSLIEEHLRNRLLLISTLDDMKQSFAEKELIKKGVFDPFSVVDIDSVLISSRHLFRMVYSVNEKSGLVSVPVLPEKIAQFRLRHARMEEVTTDVSFFEPQKVVPYEAAQLMIQAFDWHARQVQLQPPRESLEQSKNFTTELPKIALEEPLFPPCVTHILQNGLEDGKKRAIFILINFLSHMGWDLLKIQDYLLAWNKKQVQPLREGYLLSQLSWHRKNALVPLPPNCDHEGYYKALGICNPDFLCHKIKNPVHYALRKARMQQRNQKEKRKKKT